MTRSESIGKLAEALAQAQGEMRGAAKDAANPFFKSKYADLASCWDAIRGPFSAHGLSVLQPVRATGAEVTATTILAHSSGEFISEDLNVTAKDESPQSVGSAITYARRYGLSAMVGIAPEDDDGNGAQPEHRPPPRARPPQNGSARPTPEAALAATPKPDPVVVREPDLAEEDETRRKAKGLVEAAAALGGEIMADPTKAKLLWKRATNPRTLNMTLPMFENFVGKVLGTKKPSKDWTAEDLAKLDAAITDEESGDIKW